LAGTGRFVRWSGGKRSTPSWYSMWARLRSTAPGENVTGYCPLGIAEAYGFDVRTPEGTRHELLFRDGASVYVLRRSGGTRAELVAAAAGLLADES
jgi:hypothetical protein